MGAAARCIRIAGPPTTKGNAMAKPNYNYQKRQRELAKKKKKEEKRKRKHEKSAEQATGDSDAPSGEEALS